MMCVALIVPAQIIIIEKYTKMERYATVLQYSF